MSRAEHAEPAMAALQGRRGDAEGFTEEVLFGRVPGELERLVGGVAGGAVVGDDGGKS